LLYNLIEQLDTNKHKFGWIGDYDIFMFTQVMPHVKKALRLRDENEIEVILNLIDLYFQELRKMVSYECSKKTRIELKEFFDECVLPMQECAIRFLMQKESVDYILVGMRKPLYVHQILLLQR